MGNQYHTGAHQYEIPSFDPDLQRFNSGLRQRTHKVLGSIAKGVDHQERSISFESLKDVTYGLLDMDQEVLKVILESKADVWANKELMSLVEEYFEMSLKTLDFCVALEKCVKKARDEQLIIDMALRLVPKEESGGVTCQEECRKIMEELRMFRLAGSPFGEQIALQFQSVYRRHLEMQTKLRSQKKKLDKKLKYVKGWMRVSSVILAATCAALLICSLVAAAIAAPPVASAMTAAASIPLDAMGKWFKSLASGYEFELRARRDLVQDMYLGTFFSLKDLDTIRILVDRLEGELDRIMRSIAFGERHGATSESISLTVHHIRKQQAEFMEELEEFEKHIDMCNKTICKARTVVLQRIIHHSSEANINSSTS